ncbi:MAG: gamma-glutamyltransferase [bacterium]|nr:gamma-glutamyltransferase [bacterium]
MNSPLVMRRARAISGLFFLISGMVLLSAGSLSAASPTAVSGSGGAVASAAPTATEAGLKILRDGGNAVDAAVATALALAVVHPQAGNLGGGGFAVVRLDGVVHTLDFRETGPAEARHDMFLDRNGNPVRNASRIGPLAAGVPGSPKGLHELHSRHGKLSWQKVVAPAIRLAEDGFRVTRRLERSISSSRELLERFPETAEVWLPDSKPPVAGSIMRLPALAATLRAYSERGPSAITEGPAAHAIEAISRKYGGVLRAADLAAYRPVWRDPIQFRFLEWEVASMPLPSSGGVILGQICDLMVRLKWEEKPRSGADRTHLLAETLRRAYADRYLLGDPASTRAKEKDLLVKTRMEKWKREISLTRATSSSEVRSSGPALAHESTETTHLSVLDGNGNAVALTTTINGSFGCGLVVPGLGFLLNNEMDDFAAAPGKPNMFGLIQGEANAVAPGRRMLSSMTPTVAWRGSETLVLGAPGGSRIPTSTAQVLLNLVLDSDELQAAVNRPRIHHQWLPDQIFAEVDALSPETVDALQKRGHRVKIGGLFGRVNAVRLTDDGRFEAAADPRGPGHAGVTNPGPE